MQVGVALYGAARVIIGQPLVDVTFDTPGITLGQVLEKLAATYPRARSYLLDGDGGLPFHIRVLINDVRPNPDATLATILHNEDRVALLVAVAGGEMETSPSLHTFLYAILLGVGGSRIPSPTTQEKLCQAHHRTRSPGPKRSNNMNSQQADTRSTVSGEETNQHGKAGWMSTPRLRLWGRQDGSRFSKKPGHAGQAIGMPIAHRRATHANAISDPRPG